MGCDIHLVLERNAGGKWIGVDTFQGHHRLAAKVGDWDWSSPIARSRNYRRFAALAGVRGAGPVPHGLPADVSETAKFLSDEWGIDGHSHSWLPLDMACRIFLDTHYVLGQDKPDPESIAAKFTASYFFNVESDQISNFRIVFWFDN